MATQKSETHIANASESIADGSLQLPKGSVLVSIAEARDIQSTGWKKNNPNFKRANHPDADLPHLFKAAFAIHWRPINGLPESEQFAIVTPV